MFKLKSVLTEPRRRRKTIFASLFVLLAILPFFLYLSGSISPDEGYYMFIASNIGDVPDSLALQSPPGIFYLLALLFSIFGKFFYVARSAVFISNALSAILLFFIGRKLWGQKEGMLASLLFLVGVLIPAFEGYYGMTEPFMVLFLLLGVVFFLKSEKRAIYLVLSGVAVGLSILFKQFAGLLLLSMIAFYLCGLWPREKLNREWMVNSIKELSLICSGVLIPILATAAYFWSINGFDDFMQGIVLLGMHWPRTLSLYSLAYQFASYSIVWVFSVVSVLAIAYAFVTKRGWNKEAFVAIWLVFSLYALSYQQCGHYIVSILPPACLLASLSLSKAYPVVLSIRKIKNSLFQREYVRIFTTVCAFALTLSMISVIAYSGYYGQKDRASLFDAQLQTANYIQSHTEETDKIFAFTKGPSIHFLSGRDPPLRFFYINQVSVPDENAESEVINRLEESNLKYIVVTNREAFGHTTFWQIEKYIQDNYVIEKSIGKFDIYKRTP